LAGLIAANPWLYTPEAQGPINPTFGMIPQELPDIGSSKVPDAKQEYILASYLSAVALMTRSVEEYAIEEDQYPLNTGKAVNRVFVADVEPYIFVAVITIV
jgi:hypothetical protein